MTDNMKHRAKLARAEAQSPDGCMSASLDANGELAIRPATPPQSLGTMLTGEAGEEEKRRTQANTLAGEVRSTPKILSGEALAAEARKLGYSEEMTEDELDERTAVLQELICDKMAWERGEIVKSLEIYGADCAQRSEKLMLDGGETFNALLKRGDTNGADAALEQANHRAAAFRVRAAITLDIAKKVAAGFGRDLTGEAV